MLRQSARRRALLQRYLRHSPEQLCLPCLCPALYQPQIRHSRHTQTLTRPSSIPRQSAPSPSLSRHPQSRDLASAATDHVYPVDDQYIPFNASDFESNPAFPSSLLANPPLYDASKLLMLDNPLPIEPTRLRRGAKSEVGGDASEIIATFQACLHVGKFDRAEGLVERLGQIYDASSEELITINHQYVRHLVRNIEFSRRQEDYKRLTRWIDKDMIKLDIRKDGLTYAALLRCAFLMLDGAKQERTVKKYWQRVQVEHLEARVIQTSLLTDADLGLLSEICPSEIKTFAEQYEASAPQVEIDGEVEADIDINPESDIASAPGQNSNTVMSVDQRGLGLRYLQESLKGLSQLKEDHVDKPWLTREENVDDRNMERQLELETTSVDTALRRWKEEREISYHHHDAKKLGPHLFEWQQELTKKIQEELDLITEAEKPERKQATDQDRLSYGPFLRLVPTERLAGLTIITLLTMMAKLGNSNEIKMSSMIVKMGQAVHMEAIISSINKPSKHGSTTQPDQKDLKSYVNTAIKNDPAATALRRVLRRIKSQTESPSSNNELSSSDLALSPNLWSNVTYAKIGGVLAQLLTDVAKVKKIVNDPETGETIHAVQPAFQRHYKYELGKRTAFLKMHEFVEEKLRQDPSLNFIVKHLPMVHPPKPWKGFYDGAYLKTTAPVIRHKHGVDRQKRYVEVAAQKGDLKNFFAGLDVLGQTSWKINRDVYKVMLEAWNSGEAVANIAPSEYREPAPAKPEDWSESDIARRRWYTELRKHENKKTGLHSERCFQNLQMEIAQNYLNEEKFYLPHNADFRGRAYPLAPYLNQMGADHARALLLFGEGRPLGVEGLRWLKIHLANVFGYDKASFKDRELFAMNHLDDIRDSVESPLTGRRWWLEAEDPWQCLATCFELQRAFDSPDPSQYVSHLPVHQDGSCNGLQHYAALGGDIAGAQQVNLEPGDKPSDVYTGVAELVKADIAREAAQGSKMAKLLQDKIKRKIVKQTVMTNVYGVTYFGAQRQVKKQLEAHYPELNEQGGVPISGLCASYIARKIFKALGSIFTGAHDIQFWLGDCASRISASLAPEQIQVICEKTETSKHKNSKIIKSMKKKPEQHFRSSVTWTTPLNLTVVQPYHHVETTLVSTAFQQVSVKDPQETDTVDKRRQLQAFPPNFVHSLDATHMILSALRCNVNGLSFSAVHDSFWTHAADVNEMNRLLRDAFVQMHSEDVIGRLATEFDLRYSRHIFRAGLQLGQNPLHQKIRKWRASYKKEHKITRDTDLNLEELKLEARRQELLRSLDPVEQKLGKEMVTPASLFEEHDGERFLSTRQSLGATALGHIPETAPQEIIKEALDPTSIDPDVDGDMENSIGPILPQNNSSSSLPIEASTHTTTDSHLVQTSTTLTPREEVFQSLGYSPDKELSDAEALLVEVMEEVKIEQRRKEEAKRAGSGGSSSHDDSKKKCHIWLPMRFAKVPKRGEWDVTRLRESDYFFS